MALTIDSHQHFWRLDAFDTSWMGAGPRWDRIRRDFLPQDLEPLLRASGVDRTVFVQTQHVMADNDWALELAERFPFIAGVVGWIDPTSADFERHLVRYRRNPRFVGVRHLVHNEPDPDWVLRPDVQRSLGVLARHGVPFDLLFFVEHLGHAATLADRFPELRLVVDHLAKPHVADRRIDDWLPGLRDAAARPNVFCKLSGLVTEADWERWQPADLHPYFAHALDCFGPDRCMFGSDWPVCELAGSYARVREALDGALAGLDRSEREQVLGGTAARFYRLPDQPGRLST
jgi:L-fuconolactonase